MSLQALDAAQDHPVLGAPGIQIRVRAGVRHPVGPVEEHPVFALLNPETRIKLLASGQSRVVEIGASLSINGCVTFVLDGLLGTVSRTSEVCVNLAGSGSVLGLEAGFDAPGPGRIVALAESQVYSAPAAVLIEGLGRSRVLELCLHQALGRLHAMEVEAACNAAHLLPQRLAKWLARLHRANQERDIHLTQADLARLLGVQRTSVNAAAQRLQSDGAARFTRGRIVIRDLEALSCSACDCLI